MQVLPLGPPGARNHYYKHDRQKPHVLNNTFPHSSGTKIQVLSYAEHPTAFRVLVTARQRTIRVATAQVHDTIYTFAAIQHSTGVGAANEVNVHAHVGKNVERWRIVVYHV